VDEPEAPQVETSEIDPAQVQYAIEQLRSEENLPLAVIAGTAAAAVGAGLWMGITVATGYQIGFMAIGVGLLVAFSVRAAGRGLTMPFQIVGATLALLGCLFGNFLTLVWYIADYEGMGFGEVLAQLDPAAIPALMIDTFSGMDLLFYALAVYEGYRLSLRPVTEADLLGSGVGHSPASPRSRAST
jgi:hypothetical protein